MANLAQAASPYQQAYQQTNVPQFGESIQHVNTPDELAYTIDQASHPWLRGLAGAAKGALVGAGTGLMAGSLPGAAIGAIAGGTLGAYGGIQANNKVKQDTAIRANMADKIAMSNNAVYNRDTGNMENQLHQEYIERYGQEPPQNSLHLTATNATERDKQATALHNQIKNYALRENKSSADYAEQQRLARNANVQSNPTAGQPAQELNAPPPPGSKVTRQNIPVPNSKLGTSANPVQGALSIRPPVPVAQLPQNETIDPLRAPASAFTPAAQQPAIQKSAVDAAQSPSIVYKNIQQGGLAGQQQLTEGSKRKQLESQAGLNNARLPEIKQHIETMKAQAQALLASASSAHLSTDKWNAYQKSLDLIEMDGGLPRRAIDELRGNPALMDKYLPYISLDGRYKDQYEKLPSGRVIHVPGLQLDHVVPVSPMKDLQLENGEIGQ